MPGRNVKRKMGIPGGKVLRGLSIEKNKNEEEENEYLRAEDYKRGEGK